MSPKELLYIEDALGHTTFLEKQCRETAEKLQDTNLKNYVLGIATKHKQTFDEFYKLV